VIGLCKLASELKTFTAKSSNRELKKKEVLLVDQSNTAVMSDVLITLYFLIFEIIRFH
jgi:hypothetical protein